MTNKITSHIDTRLTQLNVKAFFETHNSSKVYTLPDMTADMLNEISSQIPMILAQSPFIKLWFDFVDFERS